MSSDCSSYYSMSHYFLIINFRSTQVLIIKMLVKYFITLPPNFSTELNSTIINYSRLNFAIPKIIPNYYFEAIPAIINTIIKPINYLEAISFNFISTLTTTITFTTAEFMIIKHSISCFILRN